MSKRQQSRSPPDHKHDAKRFSDITGTKNNTKTLEKIRNNEKLLKIARFPSPAEDEREYTEALQTLQNDNSRYEKQDAKIVESIRRTELTLQQLQKDLRTNRYNIQVTNAQCESKKEELAIVLQIGGTRFPLACASIDHIRERYPRTNELRRRDIEQTLKNVLGEGICLNKAVQQHIVNFIAESGIELYVYKFTGLIEERSQPGEIVLKQAFGHTDFHEEAKVSIRLALLMGKEPKINASVLQQASVWNKRKSQSVAVDRVGVKEIYLATPSGSVMDEAFVNSIMGKQEAATAVTTLNIHGSIQPKALTAVFDQLLLQGQTIPNLVHVSFSGITTGLQSDKAVKKLLGAVKGTNLHKRCAFLKTLSFRGVSFGPNGLKKFHAFFKIKSLVNIDLSDCGLAGEELPSLLEKCFKDDEFKSKMESLILAGNMFNSNETFEALNEVLPKFTSLKKFVWGPQVGDEAGLDCSKFFQGLIHLVNLEHLDISGITIGNNEDIAQWLGSGGMKLRTLSLRKTSPTVESAEKILKTLSGLTFLEELDISALWEDEVMTTAREDSLVKFICDMPVKLKVLTIEDSNLTDAFVLACCDELQFSTASDLETCLETLGFRNNRELTSASAVAFSMSSISTNIRTLDFRGTNMISDEEGMKAVEKVRKNCKNAEVKVLLSDNKSA